MRTRIMIRVLRGGGWDIDIDVTRSATRVGIVVSGTRIIVSGFRLIIKENRT